jgi:hypothetical protein
MPIISTPDGAMTCGATGSRHGPLGTQTAPTCPIIQLAIGMVRQNKTRNIAPSMFFCFSMVTLFFAGS